MTGAQNQTSQTLGVTFFGFGVSSAQRAAQQITSGTPVSVSMNGAVLASGALDSSHRAKLTFASVGGGALVKLSAGSLTPSIVLSRLTSGTISKITIRSNGSMLVESTNDQGGTSEMNCTDTENQQTEVEDSNGENEPTASPSASPAATPTSSPTAPPTCAPTPTDNPPTQSPSPSPSPSPSSSPS
jgi:hypothetical protein